MKVRKFLSVFLAAMLLLSVVPLASSATEGIQCGENAYLTYDEQTHTLTVSGEGDMWNTILVDDSIVHEVETIVVEEGITSVGAYAFAACDVKNVRLPSTLKKIGDKAFQECPYLEEILLPENLETIGINAFYFCRALREVVIPESVKSMGSDAFSACTHLERAIVNANIETLSTCTFANCTGLKELVLPKSLRVIESLAVANCLFLEKLVLPENVETVGEAAFYYDLCLQDVIVLNDSLELDGYSCIGFIPVKLNEGYTYAQFTKMYTDYYEKALKGTLTDEERTEFYNGVNEMRADSEDGELFVMDSLTLHCNADAKAHEYAIKSGFEHTILGSDYDCACGKHNVYVNDLIPATCTEDGYKGGTVCLECEEIFEAAEVIPATGHTPKTEKGKAPTCTEEGAEDRDVCAVCGVALEELKLIPATGHTDANGDGVCDSCGEKLSSGKSLIDIITGVLDDIAQSFSGIINAILALFRKLFGKG